MSRLSAIFALNDAEQLGTGADTQQVALAIANLPSFARRVNALSATVDRKAAQLGESDPGVQAARARVEQAAAKLRQLDNAVRFAYSRAVAAGQLPEIPAPTAYFDDADSGDLSGAAGTIVKSIIAVVFAIAAVIVAFLELPFIAILLGLGALIAGATALVSQLGDAVGPGVTGSIMLAVVAGALLFLGGRRKR